MPRNDFPEKIVPFVKTMCYALFSRGQSTETINKMEWSELCFWFECHEAMCKAEDPKYKSIKKKKKGLKK